MWGNARPICQIWWASYRRKITRLDHLPDTLWGTLIDDAANGMDEFCTHIPQQRHSHLAWLCSDAYNTLHQWCANQRTCNDLSNLGQWLRMYPREPRHLPIHMGTFSKSHEDCPNNAVLVQNVFGPQIGAMHSRNYGSWPLVYTQRMSTRSNQGRQDCKMGRMLWLVWCPHISGNNNDLSCFHSQFCSLCSPYQ